jgi:hypothetical protein
MKWLLIPKKLGLVGTRNKRLLAANAFMEIHSKCKPGYADRRKENSDFSSTLHSFYFPPA